MPSGIYKRTKPAWNKDRKIQTNTGKTHFKKGHTSWNKNKKGLQVGWNKGNHIKTNNALEIYFKNGGKVWNKNTKGLMPIPWNKNKKTGIKPWLGKKRPDMTGKNHPKYKGGITPINQQIRGSLEYKLWSDSVWNRDNNRCQKCSENRLEKLVAHHILNFAQFPELRFAIDNGITFCRKCHNWFHRVYGKKNNNLEQIYNFLMKKYDER